MRPLLVILVVTFILAPYPGVALEDCLPFATVASQLTYCAATVTWDISPDVNSTLAAREHTALLEYQELMYKWRNDTSSVPVQCLSFEPVLACTRLIPKCVRGASRDMCKTVCEERNFRCRSMETLDCIGLPEVDCSASARLQAAGLVVNVILVMTWLVLV